MLRNKLYYRAKPFIPREVRMAFRRSLARRQRRHHTDTWPIDPACAATPAGWCGWPEGKHFALVLTHDVEGPQGLARVPRLAELERELGFRSSFNFVPEGTYEVPAALRTWLVSLGMEVGIHDLHHDGRLLETKEGFRRNAARINRHLREWDAVGFRAGFMLHNLDWFHELAISYDLSTFDTDPFEPQPEPAGTLFPFTVPLPTGARVNANGARTGYVELPYTLPQDSTLFLVLEEKTPAVWIQKLDWVAAHGGMVLVNVHPDYTRFPDEREATNTYPVDHYRALLEHVAERHAGAFWHALPREIAAWIRRPRGARELCSPLADQVTR